MNKDELRKFFEDTYLFEHQRKELLNARVNLPLTTITLLTGGLTYLINNIRMQELDCLGVCFAVSMCCSAIALVVGIVAVYRFLLVHDYEYLSTLDEISEHLDRVHQYNARNPNNPIDEDAELDDLLMSQYRECTRLNINANDRKAAFFKLALKATFVLMVLIAVSSVFFYLINRSQPSKISSVRLVQPVEVRTMAEDNDTDTEKGGESETPAPAPEPEERPQRPDTHTRSEDQIQPRATKLGGDTQQLNED